jgi:hypothetical protein
MVVRYVGMSSSTRTRKNLSVWFEQFLDSNAFDGLDRVAGCTRARDAAGYRVAVDVKD